MSDSTFSVSGLGSGFDWQSVIDKVREVEEQKVTLLTNQQTTYSDKLTAWNTFSTKLSTLESAAYDLKNASAFKLFGTELSSSSSVDASSLLSATASSSASTGSYQVVVTNKAQAEKLGSASYSSQTDALNVSGTILVNGQAVEISETDTLQDVRKKINNLNTGTDATGVSASIVQDSTNSYRLVLTSSTTGAAGISLQNGSASDTLASLGFNGSGTVIKNSLTGGAASDAFSSSSTSVEALLGIESQDLSGTVTINGTSVDLDLTDSLDTIKNKLTAAGISASVVSSTSDSTTTYRLNIEGMTSWTDQNNVLQALGLVEGQRNDSVGTTGSAANTTDGSTAITASTKIADIYGYLNQDPNDKIVISGTTHDGTTVGPIDFSLGSDTTVGDLLSQIESAFGDVTASVTSDGKIQVVDNATGTSQLTVSLQADLAGTNSGTLDFGTFGSVGTVHKYVLQQGEDAVFSVDGFQMTSSSNTVTNAISGVTLNLQGEDSGTTVTVNVDRDTQAVEDKVNAMISAYNDVITFVNEQMTYDTETGTTGGALFGDNTLKSIKSNLQSTMLTQVGTSSIKYMSDIGITIGSDNMLTLNTDTFESALETNFTDVVNLLADSGTSTDSSIQYSYNSRLTASGTYTVDISQLAGSGQSLTGTIDGYDVSGSGSTLTLSNSASKANGLVVSFTGSTVPASAQVTVSRGIASLLESVAYQVTDPVSGSVELQKTSIQKTIDDLDSKISDQETLIDQKMNLLQSQFIAMEDAVTKLQAMQSYLTSQFSSSSSS